MSEKMKRLKMKGVPLSRKEASRAQRLELLMDLERLEDEKEEDDEGEDLFLIWLDRHITVHFQDGSAVEGIFRQYSKGTLLLESFETEAIVLLSDVKFISIKNIDNTTGRRGGELC